MTATGPGACRRARDAGTADARVTLLQALPKLHPGASAPEVRLETPAGVSELDVAADLAVAGADRPAGEPDDALDANTPLLVAVLGALLLLAAAHAAVVRRARRRSGEPFGEVEERR